MAEPPFSSAELAEAAAQSLVDEYIAVALELWPEADPEVLIHELTAAVAASDGGV